MDPSTLNNTKMREAAWKEVTDTVNLNFATNLTRTQVRRKYNDTKYIAKAKVTKAVEAGGKEQGKKFASNWQQYRKHAMGTGKNNSKYL